jgi:arylsulfatase A-like enzyme
VKTPNFTRLAEKTITFDTCYVGSMPCMPARRELHTGRYNFLHRSWGPIEPFDDSMPELLRENGVYAHFITDHYHYFEEGGSTYHTRYSSWECVRGQEHDPWKPAIKDPDIPETVSNTGRSRNNWVSRKHIKSEADHFQNQTFSLGLEFLQENHDEDNWFLHLETFDPHEPFMATQRFRDMYPSDGGTHFDWPPYRGVEESEEDIQRLRMECAALHSQCDENLGKILDVMDQHDMWKDTMLIINTDHGYLLGEHGCWAKCWAPFYNEVAHTPLFIWDPRVNKKGERRQALVQTIDLPATILDAFDAARPKDMQGVSLKGVCDDDTPVRKAGLFGLFGGHVNCTDGRYVYMRGPAGENAPLDEYTLMPTIHGNYRSFMSNEELSTAELVDPFPFTKGLKTMKIDNSQYIRTGATSQVSFPTALYDLQADPGQQTPVDDADIEATMIEHMTDLMAANDAPAGQYQRLGLEEASS